MQEQGIDYAPTAFKTAQFKYLFLLAIGGSSLCSIRPKHSNLTTQKDSCGFTPARRLRKEAGRRAAVFRS
jgi:hypothetical protein